ncbi:oligosaccharide flippase family protein [Paraglaciecola sp.]|uniref:oligosaccharide flippase family protein n=1 Tax=Paraglaciecola sp. TaxID=1920173 RepID=UPI0030F4B25C
MKEISSSIFFSTSAKILTKVLGIASTLLLARILTPSDFAVVAVIAIAIFFFEALGNLGGEFYILRKRRVTTTQVNTAWTLDLLFRFLLWTIFFYFSKEISQFLGYDELAISFQVASIVILIKSFRNPGIILLKRALEYKAIFYLGTLQKVVSFVVVISIAVKFKSYWAFIVADLCGELFFCVGSYIISKYKPSFKLVDVRKQLKFSIFIVAKRVVGYSRSQIDTILFAKYFTSNQLGNYQLSRDMVMLPSAILIEPSMEPLISYVAKSLEDKEALSSRLTEALVAISFISLPVVAFLFQFPEITVQALLGAQWSLAGVYISVMSLMFFYFCYLLILENVFIALGKVQLIFYFDLFSLVLISVTLGLILNYSDNAVDFIVVRALTGIVGVLVLLAILTKYIKLKLDVLLFYFIIAALAALCSVYITTLMLKDFSANNVILFLLTGSAFVLIYLTILYLPISIINKYQIKNGRWNINLLKSIK